MKHSVVLFLCFLSKLLVAQDTVSVILGHNAKRIKRTGHMVVDKGTLLELRCNKGVYFFLIEGLDFDVGKLLNDNREALPKSARYQNGDKWQFEIKVPGRGFSTYTYATDNWSTYDWPYVTGESHGTGRPGD